MVIIRYVIDLLSKIIKQFRKGHGISILVPFQCSDTAGQRIDNWKWLKKYWEKQLPGAEIIVGTNPSSSYSIPFSKSMAVNDAAAKAKGDIFVIIDADGYITSEAILHCAKEIRHAQKRGYRLWYVPYRKFYRLNKEATEKVLQSSPSNPYRFSAPPTPDCVLSTTGSQAGHWFGALIQIVPKEAFDLVGGWDPRFCGWGGEDHAAMQAFDTLYWPHKTLPSQVLHLWHPMLSPTGTSAWVDWSRRMWDGQAGVNPNSHLSGQYHFAVGNITKMRQLIDIGLGRNISITTGAWWEKRSHGKSI